MDLGAVKIVSFLVNGKVGIFEDRLVLVLVIGYVGKEKNVVVGRNAVSANGIGKIVNCTGGNK